MKLCSFVNRVNPVTIARSNTVQIFITYRLYGRRTGKEFFFIFHQVIYLIIRIFLCIDPAYQVVQRIIDGGYQLVIP